MKYYVINESYGGFELPEEYEELLDSTSEQNDNFDVRTDPRLIAYVLENDPEDLAVVKIPDTATDTLLTEYDGLETLYYVEDGTIFEAEVITKDELEED